MILQYVYVILFVGRVHVGYYRSNLEPIEPCWMPMIHSSHGLIDLRRLKDAPLTKVSGAQPEDNMAVPHNFMFFSNTILDAKKGP